MSQTSMEVTSQQTPLVRERFQTPRAAAIAGIVFSVLLITSLVLVRISVPDNPLEAGTWLTGNTGTVVFALNLVPFAGIAFLWFIGVVRDRLGDREDRFFSTVFLGSGLLFLAMLFAAAAVAGGLILVYGLDPNRLLASGMYTLSRALTYQIMNVYAMKMAGVFMIATSTLSIRTGITPRWMSFVGYGLALILILTLGIFEWVSLIFPLWVLMISVYILIVNLRRQSGAKAAGV
jgi:hypothetical protein